MPRGRPPKSSATTPASGSSRKRLSPPTTTPTRESKRAKASDQTRAAKATPKKSQHFEHSTGSDRGEDGQISEVESTAEEEEAEESGYEDEDESAVPSPSESEGELDDYSDSADAKPKKSARGQSKRKQVALGPRSADGKELWRQGVKAGLGPGNQVVIKRPKAREAGSTPYREDTVHPNTLLFLKDLKKNNDREWLKMNDAEFRQAEKDFKSFAESLSSKISEVDDTVPELPFKDIVSDIDTHSKLPDHIRLTHQGISNIS
ncbi:MAG: hypothetical protein M1822_005335 [Bathelium mastoideum]|nr:MAG: hypothetical protein M1822_005335 [Bathelium mastoideum]